MGCKVTAVEKKALLCYPHNPYAEKDLHYCGRNIVTSSTGIIVRAVGFAIPFETHTGCSADTPWHNTGCRFICFLFHNT